MLHSLGMSVRARGGALSRVLQRYALTGLFVIFALFAVVLAVTAYLGYRAARQAARDVLFSRGLQAAMSFTRAARNPRVHDSLAMVRTLADEIGRRELGISVVDRHGKVIVSSSSLAPEAGATIDLSPRLRLRLRTGTGPPELDAFEDTLAGRALVLWRPLVAERPPPPPRHPRDRPGWGPPRPPWERGGRGRPPRRPAWDRSFSPERARAERSSRTGDEPAPRRAAAPGRRNDARPDPGEGPPAPEGSSPDGAAAPRGWQPPSGPRPPPRFFVRVLVPVTLAAPVLSPARNTLVMAMISSPLFLFAGILLWGSARRAQRLEREAQARQALSALGEMSAVLAHEIRTPLASIKGNAQLLGEERRGDERIGSMVSECTRLERLVNGLLDYARPVPPRRGRCDPDRIASRAAEIVVPRAQAAGVGLLLDPCGCGEVLHADADQLLQALVNLAQNAIEASVAAGSKEPVVIRVRKVGTRVVFTVLDRGAGFGGRAGDEIFKPFHSTKEKGTGLGLAVARQIAAQHRGALRLADREDGPGARADLEIPLESPS